MNSFRVLRSWALIQPGVVVKVNRGLYYHVGLISDRHIAGELAVISFSAEAGKVVEESLSAFAGGRTLHTDGYLGQLPWPQVMARARFGWSKPYALFDSNCEHFVRYAHGLPVESPQIKSLVALSVLALFAVMAARG